MLSNEIGWNFDNTYSNLPDSFISKISPVPVKSPELTIFNYKLAEELGISLGKTHFLINQLVTKGWVKLENFKNSKNKKGYVYLLTWSGISGKTQLTWDFLKRKEEEFIKLKKEIEEIKIEFPDLREED